MSYFAEQQSLTVRAEMLHSGTKALSLEVAAKARRNGFLKDLDHHTWRFLPSHHRPNCRDRHRRSSYLRQSQLVKESFEKRLKRGVPEQVPFHRCPHPSCHDPAC